MRHLLSVLRSWRSRPVRPRRWVFPRAFARPTTRLIEPVGRRVGAPESVGGLGFRQDLHRGGTVTRAAVGSGRTLRRSSRTGGLRTSEPPAPGEEEEGGVFGALKSWAFPLGGAAAGALAGGLMGGPMGALLGATALGGAGYLVKKDYLMEGAGAAYGAVLGGLAGGPIGMAVGSAGGGLLGFVTRWIFS